jgi:uncharacterized RDD family membrane protein YckC
VWAALIDVGLMLAWAAVVGSGLLAAVSLGADIRFGPFGYNLFFLALVVLPTTIAFTVLEAGRYEATPGKLRVGLRVRADPSAARIGWGRSLIRNLLKFGLPWTLAQAAILALVTAPAADAVMGALIAVLVPGAYLASLFLGHGRTLYDWLTSTMVITTAAGRRFAPAEEATPGDPAGPDEIHFAGS